MLHFYVWGRVNTRKGVKESHSLCCVFPLEN